MAMLTDRTHRNNYYHTADKHTADMSGVTSYRGQTADSRQASFSANCKREIVPPRLEPRRPQVVGRGGPLAALACACVFLLTVRERERLLFRAPGLPVPSPPAAAPCCGCGAPSSWGKRRPSSHAGARQSLVCHARAETRTRSPEAGVTVSVCLVPAVLTVRRAVSWRLASAWSTSR